MAKITKTIHTKECYLTCSGCKQEYDLAILSLEVKNKGQITFLHMYHLCYLCHNNPFLLYYMSSDPICQSIISIPHTLALPSLLFTLTPQSSIFTFTFVFPLGQIPNPKLFSVFSFISQCQSL